MQKELASGRIRRLRAGVYAGSDASGPLVDAAEAGGLLAGTSALKYYELWLMPGEPASREYWVDPKRRRPSGSERYWRDRAWSGDGRFVVSVLHALWQKAQPCLGVEPSDEADEAFLVALESALNKQLIVMDDVGLLAERLPRSARRLLDFAVDSSQSGLETLARWRLAKIGFRAKPQVRIPGVGVVDLEVSESLLLELDGREHDFDDDRRRDCIAATLGKATLRPSYNLVMWEWSTVEAAVIGLTGRGVPGADRRHVHDDG
ncbi:hypothetical protein HQQ81_03825 [Microbacteriaceae bacterium VKM Ac-2854]|nr:hypothetical protein [Microbacteriaceae bacterium VKM Ac-2854]